MIPNGYSPHDAKLQTFWTHRKLIGVNSNLVTPSDNKIARNQRHTYLWCINCLYNHESIEKHHIIVKRNGGSNKYTNLVWLHKPCHQAVTRKTDNEFSEKIKTNLVLIKKMKRSDTKEE